MSNIIKDIESAIGKAEALLKSWWHNEPKYANILGIGINIAGTALETVFTLEGNGPMATLIGNVVSIAQQKLAAVTQLEAAVGPTPAVKTLLAGIATDIAPLESAIDIKDPKSQAAVTLAVNTINGLVQAFPVTDPAPDPDPDGPAPAATT